MHPFDLMHRFGTRTDPDELPAPGAHSAPRSPTDTDATPKSSQAPYVPSWLPPRATRDDGYKPEHLDLAMQACLAALIDAGASPLAAAQHLFAPELLED